MLLCYPHLPYWQYNCTLSEFDILSSAKMSLFAILHLNETSTNPIQQLPI